MRRVRAGALTALCVAGCASPAPGVYLPTYAPLDGRPTALVEGDLVLEEGCLWVDTETERMLILWPPGTSAEQLVDRLVVRNDGKEAVVGTRISAGGGQYGDAQEAFVRELVGEPIPDPCRATGLYWLGYEVHSLDQE